jgi:phage-related protein
MAWSVEFLNKAVRAEMDEMPEDILKDFFRISRRIEAVGITKIHEPHVKHLEGKLWEMRMQGRDGMARAIYVIAKGKRVVVVRAFIKKTEQTPRSEIEIALKRAQEVR